MFTSADYADYEFLCANMQAGRALNLSAFLHLDQPIGLWNYIRIANQIARQAPLGRLLDWGCGYGQMTYLLKRRGFQVTAFDVGDPTTAQLPNIPICRDLEVVRTLHPTQLPFEDSSFDTVLSCGVLEHVDEYSGQPGNEVVSLREIARILRPRGLLLIYQLPQQSAWQETVIRRFKLGYSHPRRYTANEISQMLRQNGYRVKRLAHANLIPKNLTGIPKQVRNFYSRFSQPLLALDQGLCRLPGLNYFAGVFEIVAQRQP
jgi:SAM-dependent methyltransferase